MKKIFLIYLTLISFTYVINAGDFKKSVRVLINPSEKQTEFINNKFDYVMTPFLSNEIRNSVIKPKLFLYRSIQGTWEDFNQFDWEHINFNENMFYHSDSSNKSFNTRILTIWNSWLMNGEDLVDSTSIDAMNHWINYYAVTASTQVINFNYDGLFIDSAGHQLGEDAVNGNMPWNYSSDKWRDGRYAALDFIKSYLPNKTVIFNGLHSNNGADSSLSLTDGGMWEDFTFDLNNGSYKGEKKWWLAIDCLQKHNKNSLLILVVKKPDLALDITARIFSVASYMLVSSQNTSLSLSDWTYQKQLQYYPEYDIDLGNPLDDFFMRDDSLFIRNFENGIVLVNPNSYGVKFYTLNDKHYKIVPHNGGVIDTEGNYNGYLTFENIDGTIEIPPVSAYILKETPTTDIQSNALISNSFKLNQNYPNPFNPTTTIAFSIKEKGIVKLDVYNSLGQKVDELLNREMEAGKIKVKFDAGNLPSGVYYYRLTTNQFSETRKMLLLK